MILESEEIGFDKVNIECGICYNMLYSYLPFY